jgi:hypothetical protein
MKRLLMMIAAASTACGTYDRYYSDSAFYDAYTSAYESTFVYGTYDPYGTFFGSESLDVSAAAIAAKAGEWFEQSDCVKATSAGPAVTLELDHCDARFGGKDLVGRVGIVLSQQGEQFRFAVTSSNLRIDGDEFLLTLDAVATASGSQRVAAIESRSRRTENVDARSSTGTITWVTGTPCVTIEAQSRSTKDDVSVDSTLAGFQQCAGRCPGAGRVTVRGGAGVFTGAFTGTDHLRVIAPNGGDRTYGLQCR